MLRFIEDACDGEPRAPRDIPATIDSVNDSEMVITIENRGGDMITMTLPAQDGMLMATCEVMASSFTNDEPEKINFGDSLLQPAPNLGDKLIEFLIPNAEAQIIIEREDNIPILFTWSWLGWETWDMFTSKCGYIRYWRLHIILFL